VGLALRNFCFATGDHVLQTIDTSRAAICFNVVCKGGRNAYTSLEHKTSLMPSVERSSFCGRFVNLPSSNEEITPSKCGGLNGSLSV
jgi:hypothetical protein